MLALIIGAPGDANTNLIQLAADAFTAPALQSLPIAKGFNGLMTAAEYCEGMDLSLADLNRVGRRAAALSRKQDYQIIKVPCAVFGEVNSYQPAVLAQVCSEFGFAVPARQPARLRLVA